MAQRQSNIELLRIVSIFLITMHHLVIRGSGACGYGGETFTFDKGVLGIIINSFCIVGVNCFILISGWFGIKNPIKAFVHLFFTFVVVSTIMNLGLYAYQGNLGDLSLEATYHYKYLWFVYDYILLAFISPFIERTIKAMKTNFYTVFIIAFTLVNVVCLYGLKLKCSDGYGLLNFVYLYYLARYMRRIIEEGKLSLTTSRFFALSYILTSILIASVYFLLILLGYGEYIGGIRYFSYNNPLVLWSSFSLFVAFALAKPFLSSLINLFAGGVFSIYIMQSSLQLCPIRVMLSKSIYADYSYIGLFVFGLAIMLMCGIIGVLVEKLWGYIYSKIKPVVDIWKDMY